MKIMNADEALELSKLYVKHQDVIARIMETIRYNCLKGETSISFKSGIFDNREAENVAMIFESYGYKVSLKKWANSSFELGMEFIIEWGENE